MKHRREFVILPIRINDRRISRVIIDPHHEKHRDITDDLILDLVRKLDGRQEIPEETLMGWPTREQIKRIKIKLAAAEGSELLPPDASKVDKMKFDLCRQFVAYLRHHHLNQSQLARQLEVDRARVNDITKYKIDRFTIDWLLAKAEKLSSELKVTVAM